MNADRSTMYPRWFFLRKTSAAETGKASFVNVMECSMLLSLQQPMQFRIPHMPPSTIGRTKSSM